MKLLILLPSFQLKLTFVLCFMAIQSWPIYGQNTPSLEINLTATITPNSSIEEEVNITIMNNENITQYSPMNVTKLKPEAENITNINHQHQQPPPNQLNYESYDPSYDYCSCDLKFEFCDLNCCCDVDCDDDERRMFAYCESIKSSAQLDEYCFKEYPVYQNNTRRSVLIKETSTSLFCIFNENVKNVRTYPDRKPVTTVQEYRKIVSSVTTTFSWSHPHEAEDDDVGVSSSPSPAPYGKGFSYGDPIVATSITSRGVEINDMFRLPGSLIMSQGFCDTLKPILFLLDSSTSCVRDVKDYRRECSSNLFLRASLYYENIYINKMGSSKPLEPETRTYYQVEFSSSEKQPVKSALPPVISTNKASSSSSSVKQPLNSQPSTQAARLIQAKAVSSANPLVPNCVHLNECTTIDWPDKSELLEIPLLIEKSPLSKIKVCKNVVNMVNYTFHYNPKDGIDLVRLTFGFTELTADNTPIKQTFNVVFKPNDLYMVNKTFPPYEFSGNRGYIFGKPILFRNSFNNSAHEINHYQIPLLSKDNGQCSINPSAIQETVKFGSNYRTGCMLNTSRFLVENQMCQSIQREIMDLLDGVNKELTYVATFGNPNISNPLDWIPILVDDEIQPDSIPRLTADERCSALVTGYSLDIYYALVGQESQTQAKIISVAKRFNKPIDFRLRCHTLLCRNKGNHFLIEVSLSVNYIDLTASIETKFAPPPIFRFQLPADFFYPFLTSSTSSSCNDKKIILICLIVSLIITSLSKSNNP